MKGFNRQFGFFLLDRLNVSTVAGAIIQIAVLIKPLRTSGVELMDRFYKGPEQNTICHLRSVL